MPTTRLLLGLVFSGLSFNIALAGPADFSTGPRIKGFGAVASVPAATALPADARFKVAFDVAEAGAAGELNRRFDSAARFLNMHARAGLPDQAVQVAIVVHGPAALDLANADKLGHDNPNAELIAALIDAGVSITLCGQTATHRDIGPDDLLPGVQLSLSAMTAHALLQQQGYTLNPW
ncbi:MAG: DsrE family protein [Xanthomonadales bacterium]|nr:DsrE family protein [Xanthomonadales bacterium]